MLGNYSLLAFRQVNLHAFTACTWVHMGFTLHMGFSTLLVVCPKFCLLFYVNKLTCIRMSLDFRRGFSYVWRSAGGLAGVGSGDAKAKAGGRPNRMNQLRQDGSAALACRCIRYLLCHRSGL